MYVLIIILELLYAICCFISIPFVNRRSFVAKRLVIGKETAENIERFKKIAEDIFNNKEISISDNCKVITEREKGNISKVKLETEKVHIVFDGSKHLVYDQAFSEPVAVFCAGFILFIYALFTIFLLLLITSLIYFKARG